MKKILFLSLMALTVITACKKDSLGTKPVITFKSYSSGKIIANNGLDITFQVKDGDGDIQSTLNFAALYDTDLTDTLFTSRPMPNLDSHAGTSLTADVILHLGGIDFIPTTDNLTKDSVQFLVYIIDDKSNHSDTIATPKVAIEFQ
jgi:hypothetical protein